MPVLSVLILIFIVWLQYEIRKSSGQQRKDSDLFWKKESQSNYTRRKDISGLDYITIATDGLPLDDKEDQTANSYRDTILKLAGQKLLNLSGYTNTELKSMYGAANMTQLTQYESNYITLISILHKWAERLYTDGLIEDSKAVLEYAVFYKTDVAKSYRLLAQIYKEQNTPEKIEGLIGTVTDITTLRERDNLIRDLKEMMP